MMALSGVRISWLMRARKSDLLRRGTLGQRSGLRQFLFGALPCVMSRTTAQKPPSLGSLPIVMNSGMKRPLRLTSDHFAAIVEHAGDAIVR